MKKNYENIIDLYVEFARKIFNKCSISFGDFDNDIVNFLRVSDIKNYSFIIDSYYLLEDTQLAKNNFKKFGSIGPTKYENFGEIYLRVYGVLNACYLQQQAILVLCEKFSISVDKNKIKNFPLFDLRNTFASHTVNRGNKSSKRSYVLDRHSLIQGKLRGYSSNHKSEIDFKDADIADEILNWDILLSLYLNKVSQEIAKASDRNSIFDGDMPKYSEVFERINKIHRENCNYTNVWDESSVCVTYV